MPLFEFQDIEKSFFGIRVLKRISLAVQAGRIMGLVGENGAGKSTLMNVLGGNVQPDAGTMALDGFPYQPNHPRDAQSAGIAFVHQELNLFPNLSIAENLFLAGFPVSGPLIRRGELHRRTAELLRRVGLDQPAGSLVERLSTGERQLVEIARALSFDARLILLDEPTTSLSSRECERLFTLVRQLRAEGRSIIYVSHALGDVLRLCDDVVVLRDGELVGRDAAANLDYARLVSLMVGRQLNQVFPDRNTAATGPALSGREPVLEVNALTQRGICRDISFKLHRGEVLGVCGLMGAGRTELARILFGLEPHERGTISVAGAQISGSPRARIRRGMAFLTEERRQDGLCLEASIADNIALVTLPKHARTPLQLLDGSGLRTAVARIRDAVRLQASARVAQPVKTLSGGNQQKVVLAKWLLAEPQALILDEPTRGIDVGAKFEIYQLIHDLANRGAGVLLISSEIEELIGMCDRIIVMSRGRISAEFPRAKFDRERILGAALTEHGRDDSTAEVNA